MIIMTSWQITKWHFYLNIDKSYIFETIFFQVFFPNFSTTIALWSLERPLAWPLVRNVLWRGGFLFSPTTGNGSPSTSGGRRGKFFCKLFGCKDFRGMILPLSMIRVRQSWDTETRVFARRRNTFSRQAVAPLGGVLNDRSGAVLFAARRTTNREPPK